MFYKISNKNFKKSADYPYKKFNGEFQNNHKIQLQTPYIQSLY